MSPRARLRVEALGEREGVTGVLIPIARAPCQYGGTRPFFVCSGAGASGCGRRVVKLYFSHGRFLCRCCSQLVYASKYERPWQRMGRKAAKLRQRLGITGMNVPERPHGMLVRDYERLLAARY